MRSLSHDRYNGIYIFAITSASLQTFKPCQNGPCPITQLVIIMYFLNNIDSSVLSRIIHNAVDNFHHTVRDCHNAIRSCTEMNVRIIPNYVLVVFRYKTHPHIKGKSMQRGRCRNTGIEVMQVINATMRSHSFVCYVVASA